MLQRKHFNKVLTKNVTFKNKGNVQTSVGKTMLVIYTDMEWRRCEE